MISILLPNTTLNGGKSVVEKLKDRLNTTLDLKFSSKNFVICSYPENPDCPDPKEKQGGIKATSWNKPILLKMEDEYDSPVADVISLDSSFILNLERISLRFDWQLIGKRLVDIVGAFICLIIFSPLMLIIAGITKLTSSGPVLFRQKRLGYQGKTFTFLKFRSMYLDSDEGIHQQYVEKLIQGKHDEINMGGKDVPYYKLKKDPRVTPWGKILRKSSLDELPQLFNVMMGDMSLVGPRPPIPYELSHYKNWHVKRILDVKPGITGLWQIMGRSKTTFEEMVRLDLQYAKNWNLWLDLKILLGTVRAVFSGKGAE
jgi:lipopolysaccharide/colanic/teichoic acid biosynthesis glycosyltransferase